MSRLLDICRCRLVLPNLHALSAALEALTHDPDLRIHQVKTLMAPPHAPSANPKP